MGQEASLPPRRRSFRERMDAVPAGEAHDSARGARESALSQTASHPLTQTSMTSVGGLRAFDTALRVNDTGEIRIDDHVARVSMGASAGEREILPLPLELAQDHHLFCVGASVEDDELEALAVSAWDEAHWVAPGRLHLRGGVELSGPWSLPVNVRGELGLGADLTSAWVLECEPMRGARVPEELRGSDRWAEAFPEGLPFGTEYQVLLVLERMARRLAGALRIAGSGRIIQPDPDSAVSLAVYTPRWLGPAQLAEALSSAFPEVIDSRELIGQDAPPQTRREAAAERELRSVAPELSDELREVLARDRERAEAAEQVVDGYALLTPIANQSMMMIEAHQVERAPHVLRWEQWAQGAVIEYRLRWLPKGQVQIPEAIVTRSERLERMRSIRDIESAATIIHAITGGAVVDEDDFLVSLDDSIDADHSQFV